MTVDPRPGPDQPGGSTAPPPKDRDGRRLASQALVPPPPGRGRICASARFNRLPLHCPFARQPVLSYVLGGDGEREHDEGSGEARAAASATAISAEEEEGTESSIRDIQIVFFFFLPSPGCPLHAWERV